MADIGKTILGSVPHILLTAALLLYVPWVLGIPGTATADYADGWYIGFYALNIFIAVYAILGVLGVFSRFGFIPISFRWIRTALGCSAAFFALAMTISLFAVFN